MWKAAIDDPDGHVVDDEIEYAPIKLRKRLTDEELLRKRNTLSGALDSAQGQKAVAKVIGSMASSGGAVVKQLLKKRGITTASSSAKQQDDGDDSSVSGSGEDDDSSVAGSDEEDNDSSEAGSDDAGSDDEKCDDSDEVVSSESEEKPIRGRSRAPTETPKKKNRGQITRLPDR